jgi:VWFA-related protein
MAVLLRLLRCSVAGIVLSACALPPSDSAFVDSSRSELIKAAPELNGIEFDSEQSPLDPLLRATGQQLKSMFAEFINVSMAEDVHEMRFDDARLLWTDQRAGFRYMADTSPFTESRKKAQPNAQMGLPLAGRFVDMLRDLLPENQPQFRFRYLGRMAEGGARCFVMAFLAKDGTRQGLVWVDEATKRILRVRTDVLKHTATEQFESFSRDVRFVPVLFPALATAPWLPASATVNMRFASGEIHAIHRFSDYHVDGFEEDTDATQLKEDTGEPAGAIEMEEDGIELLLKGLSALQAGKPAEAAPLLREAAARLAERIEPSYYLGLALYGSRDLAGAETQFRATVRRSPNLAIAHNEVGVVLFARGDRAGAVAEFQEAARLAPENTDIRANIEQAIGKPEASPSAGDVIIKVAVRQVLVPVVVTDKEGHHVTGLTQADFRVFEDGVEQKISAFASERADLPTTAAPGAATSGAPASPADAEAPKVLAKRHAYVICVDTMHASFANFVYVRRALQKLFQQEQAGDSQYAVIALGRTMQIIQNTTSDPAKVLETLGGSAFRKTFLQNQKSSSEFEMGNFERELEETRGACDAHDPTCPSRKAALPSQAIMLAEHEEFNTAQFLRQFGSVVEQLARGQGRRTLILISDGFLLTPGKISFGLLEDYFPEFRSTRSIERMPDALEPIFRVAAKGNVPVYTIDSRGLYTPPMFDAARGATNIGVAPQVERTLNDIATDEGMTLSEIAAATGGTAFHNSNDLFTGLKRAFADGREYYVLAYVPANEAQDGNFRKIEVKVRDSKAAVSAKRGYWATAQ